MRRLLAPWTLSSLITLGVAFPALAQDLSGAWEVQSLGTDRGMTIEQKGKKIVAHRVLWPEFEGEKYKLEHLYRGTIGGDGKSIHGQLLVKEDELPDWEVLRSFTGTVRSPTDLNLDGLPIKRKGGAAAPTPDAGPGGRDNPPPSMAMAPTTPPPPPPMAPPPSPGAAAQAPAAAVALAAPAEPPPSAAPQPSDEGANLFAAIMGSPGTSDLNLFQVSNRITIPNPVADLTEEGDTLFDKRKYKEALVKYEAAAKEANTVHAELVARLGRCHLKLSQYAEATTLLKKALRLDPNNERLKTDYTQAKYKAKA